MRNQICPRVKKKKKARIFLSSQLNKDGYYSKQISSRRLIYSLRKKYSYSIPCFCPICCVSLRENSQCCLLISVNLNGSKYERISYELLSVKRCILVGIPTTDKFTFLKRANRSQPRLNDKFSLKRLSLISQRTR